MKVCRITILTLVFVVAFVFSFGVLPASAAEKAKYGGILKINNSKEAGIIGWPIRVVGWNNGYASIPLENLLEPAMDNPTNFAPRLATGWELASDKSNYVITLREGVKFHDGTPFNAQAVKWNLDQWLKSNAPLFQGVDSVDVIDDSKIKLNLSKWTNLLLYDLITYMISPTAHEKNGEKWTYTNPVGTGPFRMTEFKRKGLIKFEKFQDYYEKGKPYLDGVHVDQIKDPMTAMASLKKGDIDVWISVDPVSAETLAKEGKWDIQTRNGPAFIINYNSVDPNSPFSNRKVREALEYAIDREAISKLTGRGFRYPNWTLFYGIDPKKAGTKLRRHDPGMAKKLLKEAGFTGLKLTLYYHISSERDAAIAFQGMLADVGVEVNPQGIEGAAWHGKAFEPIKGGEILWGWQHPNPSALKAAYNSFPEGAWPLFQNLKRPEGLDEVLDKAFSEVDLDKAVQHLHRAEKLVYDDAYFCPVLVRAGIGVNAPYVNATHWHQPHILLRDAWLDK